MEITKDYTGTTEYYTVVDGPVMETSPGRLAQGRFTVDHLQLVYHGGKLVQVYARGRGTNQLGRDRTMDRFFYVMRGDEIPDWLTEFLETQRTAPPK